jgi:hypothetical protein
MPRSKSPPPSSAATTRRPSVLHHHLITVFLPTAYPDGLAEGYLTFQAFDTLQALCSYLRGVLCTKAVLTGLGVGSQAATATSATLSFIMRDGSSMVGSLVLAYFGASSFGEHVKFWRLFADVVNDVGLTLELLAPLVAHNKFVFACTLMTSSVLKSWCGVAAGATRAAITQHFCLRGGSDVADIAAKEGSQETFVSLIGMVFGALFLAEMEDVAAVWTLFVVLTLVHVWANYRAVRQLHFRSLNWQRLEILWTHYVEDGGEVLSPRQVSAKERLLWGGWEGKMDLHDSVKAISKTKGKVVSQSKCNKFAMALRKKGWSLL